MYKSHAAVERLLADTFDEHELERLSDLYALSLFFRESFKPANYTPSTEIEKHLELTDHAKEILAHGSENQIILDESYFKSAALIELYHNEILIDAEKSDLASAIGVFSKEISRKKVILAPRYGRDLYDHFNDNIATERSDVLDADDAERLLSHRDQGVYQIGTLVAGPFGLLRSDASRFVPPSRTLPLWHCADTGCQQIHSVRLQRHTHENDLAARALDEAARDLFGAPSEWGIALAWLHRRHDPRRGRDYYDIVELIGDGIVAGDREALTAAALKGASGPPLRAALEKIKKNLSKGSAEDLAHNLGQMEQLHLLATLSDQCLVELIDQCVLSGSISIPPSELRGARASAGAISEFDTSSTLSMFGVRADKEDPALTLAVHIWEAYESAGQLSDLSWRCYRGSDEAPRGAVLSYMKEHGAREAVKNLVLPNRSILNHVCDRMILYVPSDEAVEATVDRMLWKFGFNPSRYDGKYLHFYSQLEKFRSELLCHGPKLTNADRDAIRSVGVNVFVSTEHFIEEIVAYNVWLLSNDHFLTRSSYNFAEAVRCVPSELGSELKSGPFTARWDPEGGNVLGVLLVYARAAANWMAERAGADKSALARAPDDMPHYANVKDRPFPFEHTALWADSEPEALSELAEVFERVVLLLETSTLAEVRNGLDHYREEAEFPSVDRVIACESRLSAALELADARRLIPKAYWMIDRVENNFGLSTSTMVDYRGRKNELHTPSAVRGIKEPEFGFPWLISPFNFLGGPNTELVFSIRETSVFSQYWLNYPRRLNLLASSQALSADSEVQGQA